MKHIKIMLMCIGFVMLLSGCGNKQEDSSAFHMYYINKEETKIIEENYEPEAVTVQGRVEELLAKLGELPENVNIKKLKPDYVNLVKYTLDAPQIYLTFDEGYYQMSNITEILFRAGVVRLLTQIPEIEYVSFYVNDKPLVDANDNVIGIMTGSNFIENTGNEINSYERTRLTLYYANKAGDKLVDTSVEVVYSSNISMEKLVIEKLIKGPETDHVYPTLPPNTKLLSVSIKDGVCYVNFNEGFLDQAYEVSESVPVYSVVNSLLELSNINKVQILINGETNVTYREAIHFDKLFERNLDIIDTASGIRQGEEDVIDE